MPKTGAVAVMRAGEKARKAQQRVTDAEKALAKARRASAKADATYLGLLRASLGEYPPKPAEEVAPQAAG